MTDTPRTDCCCAEHHANYGRCLQCPIHGTPPPDGTQAQIEAQPVCACGDSFTADSVCINCVTSERSSFEAQIEALQRELDQSCNAEELRQVRAENKELRADAERYRYQFSSGEWDYNECWIGEKKTAVDAIIDEMRMAAK